MASKQKYKIQTKRQHFEVKPLYRIWYELTFIYTFKLLTFVGCNNFEQATLLLCTNCVKIKCIHFHIVDGFIFGWMKKLPDFKTCLLSSFRINFEEMKEIVRLI